MNQQYLPFDEFSNLTAEPSCAVTTPPDQPRFRVEISKEYLVFEPIPVGSLSQAQKTRIVNTGLESVWIRSVTVVGDFTVTMPFDGELAPGKFYEASVAFKPQRTGLITGGLYIDTGDSMGSEFVKIAGVGGNPTDPDIQAIYDELGSLERFTWYEDALNTVTNISLPITLGT